jgi:hypothetical protein
MNTMERRVSPTIADLLLRMRHHGVLWDPEAVLDAVEHPHWERARGVHDWRAYIPPSVRADWLRLPLIGRLCAFETAQLQSLEEEAGTMVTGPAAG